MNRTSRRVAITVVLFTALGLLVYLWANHQRLQVPGYGFIRVQGELLSVRFGSHLVWLDGAGRERQQLDLASAGLAPAGDHAFFSNGDLLVYNRPEPAGLAYWITRYLRLQKPSPRAPEAFEGFNRCRLPQLICDPFGRALPAMGSAFRLAVAADDTLYLADTPGFHVYRLSDEAVAPARTPEGLLRFPNQVRLTPDGLWVADTNNRRLALLDTTPAAFGVLREEVVLAPQDGRRWPHQFAADGGGWLVNMADDRMRDGSLVHFSTGRGADATVAAALLQDPLAFELWREHLWVVDASSEQLLRLDRQGEQQAIIQSKTLSALELGAAQARESYLWVGRFGLLVMGLSLVAGFAAAWLLERKETVAQFRGWAGRELPALVAAEAAPLPGDAVYWLPNRLQGRLRWIKPLLLLVVAALGYVLLQVALLGGTLWSQLQMAGLTVYAGLFVWMTLWDLQATARQRLGLTDECLVLVGQGRQCEVRFADVRYTRTHLVGENLVVFLGNPRHSVFDRKQLEQLVFPRLKEATSCPPWFVWKMLWHTRHSQALMAAVLIPVTVVLMLSLRLLS